MLNRLEGLVRCFDPCLSCATHADGSLDLVVEIVNPDGTLAERITS
jgi:NAD-reducing hydrogenase large subunit